MLPRSWKPRDNRSCGSRAGRGSCERSARRAKSFSKAVEHGNWNLAEAAKVVDSVEIVEEHEVVKAVEGDEVVISVRIVIVKAKAGRSSSSRIRIVLL